MLAPMAAPDTLHSLARCRALALAAMIEAGGRPAWVAADPPAAAKRSRRQPARQRLPAAGAGETLTARERKQLAHVPPRVIQSIARALSHLSYAPRLAPLVSLPAVRSTRRTR